MPSMPPEYKPFSKLVICGNELINGQIPLSVSGEIAFLVGKGQEPTIWLNMFTDTGLRPLIRASQPLHPSVSIAKIESSVWRVLVGSDTVLEVRLINDESAEITKLNLQPVGLNVYGDTFGLQVGGAKLNKNVFRNVGTMIALGGKKEASV